MGVSPPRRPGGDGTAPRNHGTPLSENPYNRIVDRITSGTGRVISWMVLLMVVTGAFNALARWGGKWIGVNLSSNLYLELQWYLFSLIFLLGAGYALKENAHVRVDVLYGRLKARSRALINVIGSVGMLMPFCVFVLWVSWPAIRNSWVVREGSPDPSGLPRYPIKAVIIVAFVLLLAQGVVQLIKDIRVLRSGADADADADDAHAGIRL